MQRRRLIASWQLLWLVPVVAGCLLPGPVAALPFAGELTGSYVGRLSDATSDITGTIIGSWTADVTLGPVRVNTLTGAGSFGGGGISGNWGITAFDPATNTISATWSAPGQRGPASGSSGGTADGTITLTVNTATGTATGSFTGRVFTDSGERTITGTWTVAFLGSATQTLRGSITGTFSGAASFIGAVSGTVTGSWTAKVLTDGSVSAEVSGVFDGGTHVVQTPVGTQQIPIRGTYLLTLSRSSSGAFSLAGSWTHPFVSGTLQGSGGGGLSWELDVTQNPITAVGTFSGQDTFEAPFLGSVSVSVSGTFQVALPVAQ